MISEKIYTIGILTYYGIVVSLVAGCFVVIASGIDKENNGFYIGTSSFVLGKFFQLISQKILTYHNESMKKQIENIQQTIDKISKDSDSDIEKIT